MPKQKSYTPRTFGMRYKEFSPILASQVRLAKRCKGYDAFREDVKILRETRSGCGKIASILANYYMKKICDMSTNELIKFVDKYEKGYLDPYRPEHNTEFNIEKIRQLDSK